MTKPITVELTDAQAAHFAERAESQSVSIEQLVREAIQNQLDHDSWYAAEVQKGLDQADRGETIDHSTFLAEGDRVQRELEKRARRA